MPDVPSLPLRGRPLSKSFTLCLEEENRGGFSLRLAESNPDEFLSTQRVQAAGAMQLPEPLAKLGIALGNHPARGELIDDI